MTQSTRDVINKLNDEKTADGQHSPFKMSPQVQRKFSSEDLSTELTKVQANIKKQSLNGEEKDAIITRKASSTFKLPLKVAISGSLTANNGPEVPPNTPKFEKVDEEPTGSKSTPM